MEAFARGHERRRTVPGPSDSGAGRLFGPDGGAKFCAYARPYDRCRTVHLSCEAVAPIDPRDAEVTFTARDGADAGGALEAIEELSRLNRRHPDPLRERRIVELRHAAFRELSMSPGRPSWPPDLPDPFPDHTGLPEITTDQISSAVVGGGILHHGCVRVNGLFPADVVARLRQYIDRSFDARDRLAKGDPSDVVSPWYVPFEPGRDKANVFGRGGFVRTVDVPRALVDLVEVFTEAGVVGAVTEYFNERPAMIANKWVLRRTQGGKITDFHQDGRFLGEAIRTVDCWVALSRCGPGTGSPGIDLIARRFDSILASDEGATFTWSVTEQATRAAAPDAEIISPVLEPGDALFFDERLLHRTSVGPELTTRYAIESWFVAPSSYPSKHVPVVL
jgi:hypothetical protein